MVLAGALLVKLGHGAELELGEALLRVDEVIKGAGKDRRRWQEAGQCGRDKVAREGGRGPVHDFSSCF